MCGKVSHLYGSVTMDLLHTMLDTLCFVGKTLAFTAVVFWKLLLKIVSMGCSLVSGAVDKLNLLETQLTAGYHMM